MTANARKRTSHSSPSAKMTTSFPQDQWERFEQICQRQAGMTGRETLRVLVAYSVLQDSIPIPVAENGHEAGAPPEERQTAEKT